MRRSFIEVREIPGLLAGVLRGTAAAKRRIMGARRCGRWGISLGIGALVLASPAPLYALLLALLHLTLVFVPALGSREPSPGLRQRIILSLWVVAPLLVAAAPLRLWTGSVLPAVAAILVGQLRVRLL